MEPFILGGGVISCGRKMGMLGFATKWDCTPSIVDNFLKIVKRKLRQVESFRDGESAGLLTRAMANVRNFVPFKSGSKNAHKSPFMLAHGETHGLPWVQVMNVHNAFLFTENAA